MNKTKNAGFLIIEVLLAIVILSMIFLTLFTTLSFLTNRTERSKFDTQAASLMREGVEQTRASLLAHWSTTSDGEYYPAFDASSTSWVLLKGEEGVLQGRFTRKITISRVCRNRLDSGVQTDCSSGATDPQSKTVKVSITWKEGSNDKSAEASLLVFKSK